jgi:hypothetical protein
MCSGICYPDIVTLHTRGKRVLLPTIPPLFAAVDFHNQPGHGYQFHALLTDEAAQVPPRLLAQYLASHKTNKGKSEPIWSSVYWQTELGGSFQPDTKRFNLLVKL